MFCMLPTTELPIVDPDSRLNRTTPPPHKDLMTEGLLYNEICFDIKVRCVYEDYVHLCVGGSVV